MCGFVHAQTFALPKPEPLPVAQKEARFQEDLGLLWRHQIFLILDHPVSTFEGVVWNDHFETPARGLVL